MSLCVKGVMKWRDTVRLFYSAVSVGAVKQWLVLLEHSALQDYVGV